MNFVSPKSVRSLWLVALTVLYLACTAASAGSDDMKQVMMTGMERMQEMPMSGDTDKDFAMMMKMHHEQALQMAKMELDHGKSAEMKAMATQIIAGQKQEIDQFDQWLVKQK